MSGQSAQLSISEAKAMMKRTECSSAHSTKHQGGSQEGTAHLHTMKKDKHQGK